MRLQGCSSVILLSIAPCSSILRFGGGRRQIRFCDIGSVIHLFIAPSPLFLHNRHMRLSTETVLQYGAPWFKSMYSWMSKPTFEEASLIDGLNFVGSFALNSAFVDESELYF